MLNNEIEEALHFSNYPWLHTLVNQKSKTKKNWGVWWGANKAVHAECLTPGPLFSFQWIFLIDAILFSSETLISIRKPNFIKNPLPGLYCSSNLCVICLLLRLSAAAVVFQDVRLVVLTWLSYYLYLPSTVAITWVSLLLGALQLRHWQRRHSTNKTKRQSGAVGGWTCLTRACERSMCEQLANDNRVGRSTFTWASDPEKQIHIPLQRHWTTLPPEFSVTKSIHGVSNNDGPSKMGPFTYSSQRSPGQHKTT